MRVLAVALLAFLASGPRQDLPAALGSLPPWQVAAVFKAANTRFNLGQITRFEVASRIK